MPEAPSLFESIFNVVNSWEFVLPANALASIIGIAVAFYSDDVEMLPFLVPGPILLCTMLALHMFPRTIS